MADGGSGDHERRVHFARHASPTLAAWTRSGPFAALERRSGLLEALGLEASGAGSGSSEHPVEVLEAFAGDDFDSALVWTVRADAFLSEAERDEGDLAPFASPTRRAELDPDALSEDARAALQWLAIDGVPAIRVWLDGCRGSFESWVQAAWTRTVPTRLRLALLLGSFQVARKAKRSKDALKAFHAADGVPALLTHLSDPDAFARQRAVVALGLACSHSANAVAVAEHGGLPVLAALLDDAEPLTQRHAIQLLHLVFLKHPPAQADYAPIGILDRFTRFLNADDAAARVAVLEATTFMLLANPAHQAAFAAAGIPAAALHLLNDEAAAARLAAAACLAAHARHNPPNIALLVDLGAIPLLVDKLADDNEHVRHNSAVALFALCDGHLDNAAVARDLPGARARLEAVWTEFPATRFDLDGPQCVHQ